MEAAERGQRSVNLFDWLTQALQADLDGAQAPKLV